MITRPQRLAALAILVAAACGCDLRPIVVPPGGLTGDGSITPSMDAGSYSDVSYRPDASFSDSPLPTDASSIDASFDVGTPPPCDGAVPLAADGAPLPDAASSCATGPRDGGDAAPGDDASEAGAPDDAAPDDAAPDDAAHGG